MYMKEDYVNNTKIGEINPEEESQFLNLSEIYIGKMTANYFNGHKKVLVDSQNTDIEESENNFRKTCQLMLIKCCTKMKDKRVMEDNRFFFNEKNVLDRNFHKEHCDLETVFESFSQLRASMDSELRTKVNQEWFSIADYEFPDETLCKLRTAKQTDKFWFILKDFQDGNQNKIFENVSNFALSVLCIPNSNAAPERLWSAQGLIKTKSRNRLTFPVLRACLLSAQYVKDKGGVLKFVPPNDMIEAMRNLTVNKRKSNSEQKNEPQTDEYDNVSLSSELRTACVNEELMFRKKYADMEDSNHNLEMAFFDEDDDFFADIDDDIFDENSPCEKLKFDIDVEEEMNHDFLGDIDNDIHEDKSPCKKYKFDVNVEPEKQHILANVDENIMDDKLLTGTLNKSNLELKQRNENICHLRNINGDQEPVTLYHKESETYINKKVKKTNVINIMKQLTLTQSTEFQLNNAPNILNNGLFDNAEYYMVSNETRTLGKYIGIKDHPIRDYRNVDKHNRKPSICPKDWKIYLFINEYKSLSGKSHIDGDVLDAFSMLKEKNWGNAVAIPTQHTRILLKDISEREVDSNWFMYHLRGQFKGKILMPYETNNHWCLFVADVDRDVLYHIDPLQQESKKKKN